MWCVPTLDTEYIERMEDVLTLYARPADSNEPVVCVDERPVVLRQDTRPSLPTSAGKPKRRDYEYKRCGTANVFCVTAPKLGVHLTHATADRKTLAFACTLERISSAFPNANIIHLVMDNLSTHFEKALAGALGPERAAQLWSRFRVHYTPKHGSWLNQAETEASLWSRECLGKRRIGALEELQRLTTAWNDDANARRRTLAWKFQTADAQRVFGYQRIKTTRTED
jgi:hypothetical protein